ncbi:RNA 2',3'-cyclic phosphodiesterase [Alkalibacillus silvisoli]|uniref:RNA 2',3'-cyclic phosphodiesterase n=1 Tax=Alkalibacillus silvisoli TaxID=392823 RepID=A0ABN0ZQM8_9BACI
MGHYFIGIKIPTDICQGLLKWQEAVQPYVSYRQWVHVQDFHITLKFLGPVSDQQVSKLIEQLNDLMFVKRFESTITGVSFFGQRKQPRVLFAKLDHLNELHQLKTEIESTCASLGFEEESRPFKPHITLAKKWKNPKKHLEQDLNNEIQPILETIQMTEFHLFKIDPKTQPKYEIIKTFHFTETGED